MLAKSGKKEVTEGEKEPGDKESSTVEILKEGQECPNCHFARFKRADGEVSCPICGYGSKGCG